MKGISQVCEVTGLGSPAAVLRSTGTLYIDDSFWKIPPEQRHFILLHELGHARLNTSDEFRADQYASEMYLKMGGSPRQSVLALAKVLGREGRFTNGEHQKRSVAQLERALKFEGKQMASMIEDFHRQGGAQGQEFLDNLSGKDAREQKRQLQLEKKKAQIAKQNARALLIEAKAQGTADGTRGGAFKEIAGKVIEGAQGVAAGLLGGGAAGAAAGKLSGSANVDFGSGSDQEDADAKAKRTRNMMIIGVVVLVVVAVGIYFATRKK